MNYLTGPDGDNEWHYACRTHGIYLVIVVLYLFGPPTAGMFLYN